jgi:SAM-dependent methyltransferase
MKRCLTCGATYPSSDRACNACGAHPATIDGLEAHAPDLSQDGAGFKANYFPELAELEQANFWFRARNELIAWAAKKYAPDLQSFLEIGCGTGYVLSRIAKDFPSAQIYGSEIFSAGLPFAMMRLPSARFMQMDARQIPFNDEFDAIGAFDVLEHIHEDLDVLAQTRLALKADGVLLLTVPQHRWLWSAADVHACHVRRYTAEELHRKLKATGFDIKLSTSFVSFLLPAMWASRTRQAKASEELSAGAELKIPDVLNQIFYQTMRLESGLIRMGVRFPAGGSRLIVAQKYKQRTTQNR